MADHFVEPAGGGEQTVRDLVNEAGIIQSRRLLGECRTFVRLPGGGMGARPGAHDDRVMAMAIGLVAREEMLAKRIVHL